MNMNIRTVGAVIGMVEKDTEIGKEK